MTTPNHGDDAGENKFDLTDAIDRAIGALEHRIRLCKSDAQLKPEYIASLLIEASTNDELAINCLKQLYPTKSPNPDSSN